MEKKSNDNGRNLIAKRHKILEAAMSVFSEVGYEKAHIRDIARKARVSQGTIYEAFRDKEGLLHGIPEMVMPRAIEDLTLHMNGIVGAVNKPRKFTWFYLHFFEAHPAWSKVVLLQIKPNSRFLHTQAYQLVRDCTSYAEELFRISLRAFGTKSALSIANSQEVKPGLLPTS